MWSLLDVLIYAVDGLTRGLIEAAVCLCRLFLSRLPGSLCLMQVVSSGHHAFHHGIRGEVDHDPLHHRQLLTHGSHFLLHGAISLHEFLIGILEKAVCLLDGCCGALPCLLLDLCRFLLLVAGIHLLHVLDDLLVLRLECLPGFRLRAFQLFCVPEILDRLLHLSHRFIDFLKLLRWHQFFRIGQETVHVAVIIVVSTVLIFPHKFPIGIPEETVCLLDRCYGTLPCFLLSLFRNLFRRYTPIAGIHFLHVLDNLKQLWLNCLPNIRLWRFHHFGMTKILDGQLQALHKFLHRFSQTLRHRHQ